MRDEMQKFVFILRLMRIWKPSPTRHLLSQKKITMAHIPANCVYYFYADMEKPLDASKNPLNAFFCSQSKALFCILWCVIGLDWWRHCVIADLCIIGNFEWKSFYFSNIMSEWKKIVWVWSPERPILPWWVEGVRISLPVICFNSNRLCTKNGSLKTAAALHSFYQLLD